MLAADGRYHHDLATGLQADCVLWRGFLRASLRADNQSNENQDANPDKNAQEKADCLFHGAHGAERKPS